VSLKFAIDKILLLTSMLQVVLLIIFFFLLFLRNPSLLRIAPRFARISLCRGELTLHAKQQSAIFLITISFIRSKEIGRRRHEGKGRKMRFEFFHLNF
jgi:hypothetical protein